MASRKSSPLDSPPILTGVLILITMVFASVAWFGARPQIAAIYGIIRSVELPFLNRLMPYAEHFDLRVLRDGHMPPLSVIYKNSMVYGLFFSVMTLIVMAVALSRLSKNNVKADVVIKSTRGRTYTEILERYADIEPSVRFFADYNVLDLPTNMGTARQNYTAMEMLFYSGALKGVVRDPERRTSEVLDVDTGALADWYISRFGPKNPFYGLTNDRLIVEAEIEQAVAKLGWAQVLVLYPAILRIYGFYVESGAEGFQSTNKKVDDFINDTWTEINQLKRLYGDVITLGAADDIDREERMERFANAVTSAKKKRRGKAAKAAAAEGAGEEAFTSTRSVSSYEKLFELGRTERDHNNDRPKPMIRMAPLDDSMMQNFTAKGEKGPKFQKPEDLLFFGEVVSQYAAKGYLKSVKTAREGLVELLTYHLTETTRNYPVRTGKDGCTVYSKKIENKEQKAFNQKAQLRLNEFANVMQRVLMRHGYQFGIIGAALNEARKSGIMPPNLFRWLRFCDETQPLWWFVHNVGMPSAVPENAGMFEHYMAETTAGAALVKPFVRMSILGIKEEAERYLTGEMVDEIRNVLGADAVAKGTIRAKNRDGSGDESATGQNEVAHTLEGAVDAVMGNVREEGAHGPNEKGPQSDPKSLDDDFFDI